MTQVTESRQGRVTILTMNRPEAGNRVTQEMAEQLTAALNAARRDPQVAGCVLTGHGDVFCLGGEYWTSGSAVAGRAEFARAHVDLLGAMARFGKPLVGAVNGNAHAGGFALSVACDLVYIADDATMGLPEVSGGLFPFLALAILNNEMLFDIVYNARLMDAKEACRLYLANAALPRDEVLPRAIEAVESATSGNAEVLMLGRDLYHSMRGLTPEAALDQSRFSLIAALSARDSAAK